MREIILDLETTGLSLDKEKIVEIGAIELFDKIPTGNQYQVYLNPGKLMTDEIVGIHGITNEFVADKPVFADVIDDFLDFIKDSPLVAHNANFDIGFLNKELHHIQRPPLTNLVIDTLVVARKIYPNMSNSLDSLCKRFKIDTKHRKHHGALLDSDLLAKVYFYLSHQTIYLEVPQETVEEKFTDFDGNRPIIISDEDLEKHKETLEIFGVVESE